MLTDQRLVTLVGPGGAGKTRLAGEALHAVGGPRPRRRLDGRARPGHRRRRDRPRHARRARPARRRRPRARRRDPARRPRPPLDTLAERQTILLLDNCEHLIGAVAAIADRLLADCPDLRIVATSREPLAIAGENLIPVPPLGRRRRSACSRTARRSPHPASRSTTTSSREICRRLDGLPLAIELAAARLRTMPIEQLAGRLDDRFRLLTGGSRAALPRHRTLRAVVDWSWGLLEDARARAGAQARRLQRRRDRGVRGRGRRRPPRARRPRLAGRQVAAAGRRRPLPDARDDPRVRAREARRGGRARGHAHRRTRTTSRRSPRRPSRSCARASSTRPTAGCRPSTTT